MKYKGENGSVHCLYIAIPAQKEHNFYRTLITQRSYSHCIVEIMKIIQISKLSKILSKGLQTTHDNTCLNIISEKGNEINCIDFDYDGFNFATAGKDLNVRIYDTKTFEVSLSIL